MVHSFGTLFKRIPFDFATRVWWKTYQVEYHSDLNLGGVYAWRYNFKFLAFLALKRTLLKNAFSVVAKGSLWPRRVDFWKGSSLFVRRLGETAPSIGACPSSVAISCPRPNLLPVQPPLRAKLPRHWKDGTSIIFLCIDIEIFDNHTILKNFVL